MSRKKIVIIWSFLAIIGSAFAQHETNINWNREIIYQVMPRSFYDSNGDKNGDLKGFEEKLDYLQELGVTTILFTPLYESNFYHNYFAKDYKKIDPEYGTMQDYLDFVKAVHAHGMKFLMDMETQYAQNGNIWFEDSYKNPNSKYSDYIKYSDSLNKYPYQIFIEPGSELYQFKAWPDQELNIVYLNLNNKNIKEYMKNLYRFWADPNGDGDFSDGVDGYRIDHIMDNLDNLNIFTNLYQDFWTPIFKAAREVNPNLFVVGEQSNWASYGEKMIKNADADASFGFPLRFTIAGSEISYMDTENKDKEKTKITPDTILKVVNTTLKKLPKNSYFINFLENHDTERWASVVGSNPGKLRAGAVLNLLLPGIPSIYYGQELGVTGKIGDWGYDVNHIPVREAFPWTPNAEDPGTAVFYENTGPWWEQSYFNSEAVKKFALSVEKNDKNSLWYHYKTLISIRKNHNSFQGGDFIPVQLKVDGILSFLRTSENEKTFVILNISENDANLDSTNIIWKDWKILYSSLPVRKITEPMVLKPSDFIILQKKKIYEN